MCQAFKNFELFTSSPRLKPAYFLPGESEREHRSRQFRTRNLERETNRTRRLGRVQQLTLLAAEQHAPYREVSHIATAFEDGKYFRFEVLASNGRYPKVAGRHLNFQEGKEDVEKRYSNVSWVGPYRFQKYTTCY